MRRRARRRSNCLRRLRSRPGVLRRSHGAAEEDDVRGGAADAGPAGGAEARPLRRRPALCRRVLPARKRRVPCARGFREVAGRRRHATTRAEHRRHLRAAVGIPRVAGEAARRHVVAAGGLGGRRHAVPQTVHGLGRRQIGDLQVHHQRVAGGTDIRERLPRRHAGGGRDSEEGLLLDLRPTAHRRAAQAADPEPGALAGLGDQAAHAVARLQGGVQRLAEETPADHPPARHHGQTLLPHRMGRRLEAAFHRRSDQRLPGTRVEIRQPEDGEQLSAGGLRSRRVVAYLQAPAGLSSGREGAGRGRHYGVSGGAA